MSSSGPTTTTGPSSNPNSSNNSGGGGGGGGGGDGGGGGSGNQMSNLYLYTFLATLLLLLAISVLIVGRSIFVRRRARRVMEEAIRNGTSPTQTRPAVKLGDKPVLFDVYTTKNGSPPDNISVTWADLKPLSTSLRKPASPPTQALVSPSPTPAQPPPSLLSRLAPQLRPPPRVVAADSPSYPLEPRQPPPNPILTVTVMIAMPTPPTGNSHNSCEDTFPPVQVGVANLPIPHGWNMNSKPESG